MDAEEKRALDASIEMMGKCLNAMIYDVDYQGDAAGLLSTIRATRIELDKMEKVARESLAREKAACSSTN
jgi:hypothetical protein